MVLLAKYYLKPSALIYTRPKHIIVDVKPKAEIVCDKGVHFQGLQFNPVCEPQPHLIFLTCSSFPNRLSITSIFAGQVLDLRLSSEI